METDVDELFTWCNDMKESMDSQPTLKSFDLQNIEPELKKAKVF